MAFAELPEYPWDAMVPYRQRAASHPGGIVDLSIGSPVDATPVVIREALADAGNAHGYPTTVGTAELRLAIRNWFERRRGVPGLTDDQVLPTVGSKELVALLPLLLGIGEGDIVVHPSAAYPTYAVGAVIAGATAVAEDDPELWPAGTRLVWLNSPGNPDGRVLGINELARARARARELGAVIVNDECYAELGMTGSWLEERIPSILDPDAGDTADGTLAVYSLSKQSNMAGYRGAFLAGDRNFVARLTRARKHAGLMVAAPIQRAMIAALDDDVHVATQRELYRARRRSLQPALEAAGFRIDQSEAGLYVWATEGADAWESVAKLADLGILVGPGHFYGDYYPRHIRLSLTATDERIRAACERLLARQ